MPEPKSTGGEKRYMTAIGQPLPEKDERKAINYIGFDSTVDYLEQKEQAVEDYFQWKQDHPNEVEPSFDPISAFLIHPNLGEGFWLVNKENMGGGETDTHLAWDIINQKYVVLRISKNEIGSIELAKQIGREHEISKSFVPPDDAEFYGGKFVLFSNGIFTFFDNRNIDKKKHALKTVLTFPYKRGGSLTDKLARGEKLNMNMIVTMVEDISAALDYLYRHKVYHRDVKPSNILFGPDEYLGRDAGCLIDMGISSAVKGSRINKGSLEYLPPEALRVRDSTEKLEKRIDVYAMGATIYKLITGEKLIDCEIPDHLNEEGKEEERHNYLKQWIIDNFEGLRSDQEALLRLRLEEMGLLPEQIDTIVYAVKSAVDKNPETRLQNVSALEYLLRSAIGEKDIFEAENVRSLHEDNSDSTGGADAATKDL